MPEVQICSGETVLPPWRRNAGSYALDAEAGAGRRSGATSSAMVGVANARDGPDRRCLSAKSVLREERGQWAD